MRWEEFSLEFALTVPDIKNFSNFNFHFILRNYFPYTNSIFSMSFFVTLYATSEKNSREVHIEKNTQKLAWTDHDKIISLRSNQ